MCANAKCGSQVLLHHQEAHNQTVEIDYPNRWFPVKVTCPACKKTRSYNAREIQDRVTMAVIHKAGWKPVMSSPDHPKVTPIGETRTTWRTRFARRAKTVKH
jgi:lysyl-tRNA synthetase class I